MMLKPHSYYSFSEIQEALASIGKRELCEAFANFDQVTVFYLDSWAKNDVYPDDANPDYQDARRGINRGPSKLRNHRG